MSEVIAKQINYKPLVANNTPRYYMKKIVLNNNSSNEINIDSSTLLEFKLPTSVWNLSKSKLSYTIEIPECKQGATFRSFMPADCVPFVDTITLGDATGPTLCDLNYVNRMTKVVRKLDTKLTDYLTADESELLFPANDDNNKNQLCNDLYSNKNHDESKYLFRSSSNNTKIIKNFSVPLSAISNSIFSMDKDLYFGSNQLYLKIQTTSDKKQIAWVGLDTNPSLSDATAGATIPALDIPNGIKLSNVYLWLAQEQNEAINKNLLDAYMSGNLKYNIEWSRAWKVSTKNSNPHALVSLNPQFGRRIKQSVYSCFNGESNDKGQFYDNTNLSGSKVKFIRSYMNTTPVQDDRIKVLLDEDYDIYNGQHCKNTVILNKDVYKRNFFHMDKFYTDVDGVDDSNNDSGYNLITPVDYRLELETDDTKNLDHLIWITFSRVVHVNQSGLQTDVSSI